MKSLGIDIGTSSITALVLDIETKEASHILSQPNNFAVEDSALPYARMQDPDKIIGLCLSMIDELVDLNEEIVGIGISSQMHGILYVDERGLAKSPLFTWQDGSGKEDLGQGMSLVDTIYEKFKLGESSGHGLVTALYHQISPDFSKHRPKKSLHLAGIGDYLGMRLTSLIKPIYHKTMAGSFGFFDVKNNDFFYEKIDQIAEISQMLGPVCEDLTQLGSYKNISVFTAIGDNQAAAYPSLGFDEESLLVNIGTGSQIAALSRHADPIEGLEIRPYFKDYFLLLGASLNGGSAYKVLANFFQSYHETLGISLDPYEGVEKALLVWLDKAENEEINPIKVRTSFYGQKNKPYEKAKIEEIDDKNLMPGSLVQGVIAGISYELFSYYQNLGSQKDRIQRIIGTGNALRKNPYLQEIIHKEFALPVELFTYEEEAAYGAALLAWDRLERKHN